eukprot:UN05386
MIKSLREDLHGIPMKKHILARLLKIPQKTTTKMNTMNQNDDHTSDALYEEIQMEFQDRVQYDDALPQMPHYNDNVNDINMQQHPRHQFGNSGFIGGRAKSDCDFGYGYGMNARLGPQRALSEP